MSGEIGRREYTLLPYLPIAIIVTRTFPLLTLLTCCRIRVLAGRPGDMVVDVFHTLFGVAGESQGHVIVGTALPDLALMKRQGLSILGYPGLYCTPAKLETKGLREVVLPRWEVELE